MKEKKYQALYRKWRPQRFEDVVGQRHITQTLQNAIINGNIAHAYLFCGPRGSGKTTTARLLAKALNCVKGPTPQPCNECAMCKAIADGSAMDIIEMDAASSTSVDDVRELRETVKLAPAQARYKFYIIDEVHRLSRSAFDALLKTLEEPPPNVIFVLATTEPHRVPSTIASRCQRFDFRRGSEREIKEYLRGVCKSENIDIEEDALSLLASHAEGSWRDALSLLEQVWAFSPEKITADIVAEVLGIVDEEVFSRFLGAVARGNVSEGINIIGDILDSGKDPREFLRGLSDRLKNLLLVKIGGLELLEIEEERKRRLAEESSYFSPETLLQMIEAVFSQEGILRLSPSPRLPLELLFTRLLQITGNLREVPLEKKVEEPKIEGKQKVEERQKEEAELEERIVEEKIEMEAGKVPAAEKSAVEIEEEQKRAKGPVETVSPSLSIDLEAVMKKWPEVLRRLHAREGTSNLWAVLKQGVRPVAVEENCLTLGFSKSLEFAKKRFDKDENKSKVLLSILQVVFPGTNWKLKTVLLEEEIEPVEEVRKTSDVEEEKPPVLKDEKLEEQIVPETGVEEKMEVETPVMETPVEEEPVKEENEEIKRFRSIFPEAEPLN